jgi:hypothetical protein
VRWLAQSVPGRGPASHPWRRVGERAATKRDARLHVEIAVAGARKSAPAGGDVPDNRAWAPLRQMTAASLRFDHGNRGRLLPPDLDGVA